MARAITKPSLDIQAKRSSIQRTHTSDPPKLPRSSQTASLSYSLGSGAALNPHFLFDVGLNRRMIGPTPVFMRFCGAKDTAEACPQWVNNKTSPFSSLSTLL